MFAPAALGARTAQAGQAVVEFAVLLPVLLLLTFGILQFGLVLNAQLALTEGVREGVQVAATGAAGPAVTSAVSGNAGMVQDLQVSVASAGNDVTVTATGDYPVLVPLPMLGPSVSLEASMTELADGAPEG